MNGGRVAHRYARAAFDIAVSSGQEDAWLRDLGAIEAVLTRPDVLAFLDNPSVQLDEKLRAVERMLASIEPLRRNFAYVLVEHGRASHMSAIVAEYQKELYDRQGVAVAEVTTAIPLDEAESAAVARRLDQLVGKRVILEKRVDPDILGGIVARIGDRMVDGSIVGQLRNLRRELTST